MKRLFLVYDDKDFAEWIEEELAEYGRFVRILEGLDFFFPQWNATGSADVIILPELVIKSQESFMNLYHTVKTESPETIFLLIYQREKDPFIEKMIADGNVCVSYEELDTGILENRLRSNQSYMTITSSEQAQMKEVASPVLAIEHEQNRHQTEEESNYPAESKVVHSEDEETAALNSKYQQEQKTKECTQLSEQVAQLVTPAKQPVSTSLSEPDRPEPEHPAPSDVVKVEPVKKRRTPEEQKEKLQKIKERIVIEEKIVTIHVPVHYNSMLVSVVSLYPRAGATFVTANFARMLGENKVPVSVVEPVFSDRGSTYYELMFGDKNAPKEWESWAEQLQKNGYISQEKNWMSGGVTWVPSNIEPTLNWSEEHTMQLLLSAKRYPITLCDISSHYTDPQARKILSMSDEIWIVADGDPIQLGLHYKSIDIIKNQYPNKPIKVIGNKWHSFIKQAEWKEAVLLPVLTQIPDLGPTVLKHLWAGKMAWDDANLKNILAVPFKPMARIVMAKEMYGLLKKQYGFGAKLSGLFRQMKSLENEV